MFSRFFRKAPDVLVVGQSLDTPNAEACVAASNVIPLSPQQGSAAKPRAEVTEQIEKIPYRHHALLTASDARAMIRIPAKLEHAIAAIETGPKRAAILFDPDTPQTELSETLALIRTKLNVENYQIEVPDVPCRSSVIKTLVEDYRARSGEDGENDEVSRSKAKELWDRITEIGVQHGATDFHFQIIRNRAEVQIRVDGELEPLPDGQGGIYIASQIERAISWAFSNSSQSAANSASLYNRELNLYTMLKPRSIGGKQISFRYQNLVGAFGPRAICRVLHTDYDTPTLSYEQLGYANSHVKIWREASRTPSGLFLIAGTTGSGKTTSLKTYIETHPGNGSSAFYSLENPIEYPLKGVHQIPFQIDLLDKEGSAKKYSEVVASLMRADPDGALIGEIRDSASAMAAQQLSETGHMTAATVHAHLMTGIVPRLTDNEIGMSRNVLTNPNMLALLAFQALVPMLCEKCRINAKDKDELPFVRHGRNVAQQSMGESEHIEYVLHQLEKRFSLDRGNFFFRREGGCPHCRQRGTKGLTVVAEMMIPDRQWLDHIRNGEDYEALMHYRFFSDRRFDTDDMTGKTVFEHTMYKALLGIVDPRECERFGSFRLFHILSRDMEEIHARR